MLTRNAQLPARINTPSSTVDIINYIDSLRSFSQRRSCRQVLCARCVRCDVSQARVAFFTFCVMRRVLAKGRVLGVTGVTQPGRGL